MYVVTYDHLQEYIVSCPHPTQLMGLSQYHNAFQSFDFIP